jgi:3-dehydroquinate dehydratase-2
MRIDVLHGPNLNLLGTREPHLYGTTTLAEINARLQTLGSELGVEVTALQSNHEGVLVDRLQESVGKDRGADAFILNPAGYTHTSVALRDAVLATGKPFVEVHLSNPDAREPFRQRSLLADIALGRIAGLGAVGYELALRGLAVHLSGTSGLLSTPTNH